MLTLSGDSPKKNMGKVANFFLLFLNIEKEGWGQFFLGEISFGVVRRWPKWSKLP